MKTATAMRPVILVGRNNGVGLTCDAAILRRALDGGRTVVFCGTRAVPLGGFILNRRRLRDAAIVFIERIHALWLPFGHRRILIPNQERFPLRHIWRLPLVEEVLCKSADAYDIFSRLHSNAVQTGFTSRDNLCRGIQPDYGAFFHLAGKSTFKGTQPLLDTWAAHPRWPLLTVVAHPKSKWNDHGAANVLMIRRTLSREDLVSLQNSCGVHLCPSVAEGWGHSIAEGASCRALVVTTDASPMNEVVSEDRGCLIRSRFAGPRPGHLGRLFVPAEGALEECVERVLALTAAERMSRGLAARAWFEENDARFAERMRVVAQRIDD